MLFLAFLYMNFMYEDNSTISNVNSSLSGIEKAFTFSYDVTTPDGKRRWGKYSMNLPRVSTVPYLAKGAVIPPRSEFLAVLGDQKQGNNIETPEALLRKIVREETAGRQTGGGSYRFTAQINRRALFDEMMKEAQMRRDAPFVSIAPWSFIKDECIVKYYPEGHYQKPEQITTTLHDALMIAQYYYECGVYVQFTMSLCIEWLFLYVRDDPRYSPPQQKSWYTKNVEEYPEIKTMLESEQRFEIIGALRRLPQNFLFKGLPDDIKDDYKLMDF